MGNFGQFYLDKEKDIVVELELNGSELEYTLRTPHHHTGNLITNLARLWFPVMWTAIISVCIFSGLAAQKSPIFIRMDG